LTPLALFAASILVSQPSSAPARSLTGETHQIRIERSGDDVKVAIESAPRKTSRWTSCPVFLRRGVRSIRSKESGIDYINEPGKSITYDSKGFTVYPPVVERASVRFSATDVAAVLAAPAGETTVLVCNEPIVVPAEAAAVLGSVAPQPWPSAVLAYLRAQRPPSADDRTAFGIALLGLQPNDEFERRALAGTVGAVIDAELAILDKTSHAVTVDASLGEYDFKRKGFPVTLPLLLEQESVAAATFIVVDPKQPPVVFVAMDEIGAQALLARLAGGRTVQMQAVLTGLKANSAKESRKLLDSLTMSRPEAVITISVLTPFGGPPVRVLSGRIVKVQLLK